MARITKLFRFIFHVVALLTISYFLNNSSINPLINKRVLRFLPDIKHLLIWTTLPGVKQSGQQHFLDKKCSDLNCFFTTNRSLLGDTRYFDGIIFNLQEVSKGSRDLPKVRNKYQKYIFAANDSADSYPVCDKIYEDFFNWTWTYRKDSTIPYQFVTIFNLRNEEIRGHTFQWAEMKLKTVDLKRQFGSKHKAAAIFLDKCKSRSKREVFIKKLQNALLKYNMTVDIFGKCGVECRKKTMKPCLWKLKKHYFFYLAFEDSLDKDYVTKTVLHAYENNVVPIVYGNATYSRHLPPDSYLDGYALGEEKLALKMYQTAFDPHRYLQFFKWKDYYTVKESQILDACSLCKALNNPKWLTHQVVQHDFRSWWNEHYEKRCQEDTLDVANFFPF